MPKLNSHCVGLREQKPNPTVFGGWNIWKLRLNEIKWWHYNCGVLTKDRRAQVYIQSFLLGAGLHPVLTHHRDSPDAKQTPVPLSVPPTSQINDYVSQKLQAYWKYLRVKSIDYFFATFSFRASARLALVPSNAQVHASVNIGPEKGPVISQQRFNNGYSFCNRRSYFLLSAERSTFFAFLLLRVTCLVKLLALCDNI